MRIGGREDKGTRPSPRPLSVWSGSGLGESAVVVGEIGDSVLDRAVDGDVGSGAVVLGAALVTGLDDPVLASRGARTVVSGRTVVNWNGSNHRASSAAHPPN